MGVTESHREPEREPVRVRGNQSELETTRKSQSEPGELTSCNSERETGSKARQMEKDLLTNCNNLKEMAQRAQQ